MIEVIDISKRYGDTLAVDRLSFTVRPGLVTGFLGPNGAGKTTTMRMILGLDAPSSGQVTVNGIAYRKLRAPMREVGALLDARAIDGGRTAYDHLRWLAHAGGIPQQRAGEVLELSGLGHVAGKRVGGFSLGMCQRLGIAAALLGDPRVLLFDEPVNGLDPEGVLWIRSLLRELAAEGRTVLLSSHLMNEMEATADHVLVIGRGRLIADASVAELTRSNTSHRVRVVTPQGARLTGLLVEAGAHVVAEGDALIVTGLEASKVGAFAAGHGIEIHELSTLGANLEAVFMALTRESQEFESASRSPGDGLALATTGGQR